MKELSKQYEFIENCESGDDVIKRAIGQLDRLLEQETANGNDGENSGNFESGGGNSEELLYY